MMDHSSYETLIQGHGSKLELQAFSFTKNHDDAADLAQETRLKAFRYFHHYVPGTNFSGWLHTIMRNTFINAYRVQKRKNERIIIEENISSASLMKSAASNLGEHKFIAKDLQLALESLPEKLRIPFVAYFEGYKYEEIALALNIPVGTVKTRIHSARILLKKFLKLYARI